MKKSLFCLFNIVLVTGVISYAQVGVNGTGASPQSSAGLDVDFTDKGFLLPRMTTAQRNAISGPAVGLQIYNTDMYCIQAFMPFSGWKSIVCDSPPSSPTLVCQAGWSITAGANAGDLGC